MTKATTLNRRSRPVLKLVENVMRSHSLYNIELLEARELGGGILATLKCVPARSASSHLLSSWFRVVYANSVGNIEWDMLAGQPS